MSEPPRPPFFYALQPKTWTWDRFYKIFVTERAVCGAWIAGQFYDRESEESAGMMFTASLGPLGFLLGPLINRWVKRATSQRHEHEGRYETIDPDGPDFLTADKRNFRLPRLDIASVAIKPGGTLTRMHAMRKGARLEITEVRGTKRRFILVGDECGIRAREALGGLVSDLGSA
ncbi:MAG: hypothetical protein KKB50_16855 [Planctomycetes bacterium]|nr:hypothetical protein [Planctomycetota bacterium]